MTVTLLFCLNHFNYVVAKEASIHAI